MSKTEASGVDANRSYHGITPLHFDVDTAARVVNKANQDSICSPGIWIDLGRYATYSLTALECLAGAVPTMEGMTLGFQELSLDAADILATLRPGIVEFPHLRRLEPAIVDKLRWPPAAFPILNFTIDEPLTARAAELLAHGLGQHGVPLGLTLPTLSPEIAEALRPQDHELSIAINCGDLTPKVCVALAGHAGYLLDLHFPKAPSPEFIQAMSQNPGKRLCVSQRVAMDGWYRIASMSTWYADSATHTFYDTVWHHRS